MMDRMVYLRRIANELFRSCQNRLKVRTTADERLNLRQVWALTKGFLELHPEDSDKLVTTEWLSSICAGIRTKLDWTHTTNGRCLKLFHNGRWHVIYLPTWATRSDVRQVVAMYRLDFKVEPVAVP